YPMISTKDIIWLAGLLEGEGCFHKQYNSNSLIIRVVMCDKDIIDRVASLWGAKTYFKSRANTGRKDVYEAHVWGNLATQWMMTLYSLMGIRRKTKILELLKHWKANCSAPNSFILRSRPRSPRTHCKRGHDMTKLENRYGYGTHIYCKECLREN